MQTLSRIEAQVDQFTDRQQQRIDEAALRAYERRVKVEDAVTFDELLEELASIDDDTKFEFMTDLANGDKAACNALFVELTWAKDRIVDRALKQGECK